MDEFNNDFLSSYNRRDDDIQDKRSGRASRSQKPDKPAEDKLSVPDRNTGNGASESVRPTAVDKDGAADMSGAVESRSAKKAAESFGYRYEQKSGFKTPTRWESAALPPDGSGAQNRKKLIIILSAAAVALIILIALLLALTGGTPVENLAGRPLTQAQVWANQNGLNLQVTEVYSDEVDAGVIISQETPAGTRLKKGGFVNVTVSMGPDLSVTLTLPDLMSMTKDEVEAWAKANHMTKVRITTEFSDTVPAGKVIRYEVNDNTVVGNDVRRDTPVYVIVSKGIDTTVDMVEIPDFRTMTLSECYVFANDNGLVLSVTEQYDDYISEGSIISASVKPKEKVPRGTEIKLVASKGRKIVIPDFSDYTRDAAMSVASGLGIPVSIVEKYSGSAVGAFISQSIPAGTVYERGDYLELYYSLGNKIVVPSFVGQTLDAIESWALDLNSKGARITVSSTTTNSSQPAGTIIYQTPVNTTVGVKKTITVTVSKGQVVYVPDFFSGAYSDYSVAFTREQAIARCEELKLVPEFKPEAKSGVLPGAIWYQDLTPGKEVAEGTKIVLKYSPAPAELLTVPNFTEMNKTEGQIKTEHPEYLKQFHLVYMLAEANDSSRPANVVISQSVPAGTKVPYGTMITLYTNPPF